VVLTCAHVVGAHLGLANPVPDDPPTSDITIRFEALDVEVSGRVLPGGWFCNAAPRRNRLSDIAVIRLSAPLEIPLLPAIAQRLSMSAFRVYVHGAGAGFQSYGQQVQGDMAGSSLPNGRRQIDPTNSARGFMLKRGFSGAPSLDDVGNTVWGMVSAVAEDGSGVAYAIPATDLRDALRRAGVEARARIPDAFDAKSERAMRAVREEYEGRLASAGAETERVRKELEELRRGVREVDRSARAEPEESAAGALQALVEGDTAPAAEVLRRRLDERLAGAEASRKEAAAAARQLGAMLKFADARGALAAYRQAAECEPNDFWGWIEVCRLELDAGTLGGAEQAAKAAQRAAADDRTRAVAYHDLGMVLQARGDLASALSAYRANHEAAARLVSSDSENTEWQRDLSVSHNKIGDVQVAQGELAAALASYRASHAIAERLAQADPGNAGWQYDLGISNERIGGVLEAQGDLSGALASHYKKQAIIQRLTEQDPGNAGWQRDLSVSLNKIGDVQIAQGELAAALTSYQASHDIFDRLAKADPGNAGWQRDLSISHGRIGGVQQAQGDIAAALTSYRAYLGIAERLAKADPGNAGWQYLLGIGNERIGSVLEAQGDLSGALASYRKKQAIIQRLTEQDPGNSGWQRDLSVSHEKIGDVQVAHGELAAALTSYQASLAIRGRLAEADPGNAGWQRDLALSVGRVADVQDTQGERAEALRGFQQARAIIVRLRKRSPDNATLPKDLAYYDAQVARLSQ
jgi:tetratricopeptide (TPR) repeat protein